MLGREGRDRLVGRAGRGLLERRPRSRRRRRRSGRRPDRRPVRRLQGQRALRTRLGRRERRSRRRDRRGLRARRPATFTRSVHGPGGSARVRGGAGQPHGRAYHRRDLPGRAAIQRSCGQRRLRRVVGQRGHVAERSPSGAHASKRPGRPERAGKRPGRRVRRGQSRLADRDARARGADHTPDRQPLDRRCHLERAGDCDRGLLGERDHVRQELDRLRQRPHQPPSRTLLSRLHRHPQKRPAGGDHLDRRRNHVVRSGRDSGDGRRRGIPGDPAGRASSWSSTSGPGTASGSSVSTDGAASFGPPAVIAELQVRSIRGLRLFPLPSADVDPSGRVWITWHDCRFSSGCAQNSVVVATSVDGRTWTAPTQGDDRTRRIPSRGRNPPDHREGGDRLPRRSAGWNRRRAGRVAAR